MNWIYTIFAVSGVILFAISVQPKEKANILKVQIAASLCYMVAYLVIGAYSAVGTEVIEQTKDVVFIQYEKRNKKIPMFWLFIFCIMLIALAFLTYDGILSMLPLFINLCYFVGTYIKNPKAIRWIVLCCAILWGIYNYSVGAYIIIIGNCLEVISATTALIRHKK